MGTVRPASSALDTLTLSLYGWLAELQAEWHRRAATCLDADAVPAAAEAFVREWREPVTARLDATYAEMSGLLEEVTPEERARAALFHQRLVQPFFFQSPFCRRAVDKPLGYPGDFGLVEMIFRGREEATTPLGAILGSYALGAGPSEAHRGRLAWAHRVLDDHLQARGLERPRILSFACGPEVVLREWVRRGAQAEIVLADHDADALVWAKKRLLKARPRGSSTTVSTVEANAFSLLRGVPVGEVLQGETGYDAVLVLGLLDYLTDEQVVAFLRGLAPAIRPGGLLLTSNLHVVNPWRALMEFTSDWTVAHRSVDGFEGLVRATGALVGPRTELHATGTNLYCAAEVAG
jgi:2-polyprenyl-3-methyl-5-hydroxy-6-metoxy-1,4-benzoquinol methylase